MARRFIGFALLLSLAVGAYASAPLVTAWQIREAVRTGDTARLEDKVDWPSVRKSLKSSLGEARKAISELTEAAGVPRPSVWQRLKAAKLPFLTDPLIDRYVTAEGASKLYAWRQTWGHRVHAVREAARAPTSVVAASVTRAPATWADRLGVGHVVGITDRVRRSVFVSPFRFEIELADRIARDRTWQAVLELRGLSWKLTEMRVSGAQSTAREPVAARMARAR